MSIWFYDMVSVGVHILFSLSSTLIAKYREWFFLLIWDSLPEMWVAILETESLVFQGECYDKNRLWSNYT